MPLPHSAPVSGAVDLVLDRVTRLHPKVIDLSLGRVLRLLDKLGHPERQLPPVVHVAGTNGKGSVIAYLRAILEAAGWRVHVYTSPHLVRFNERIRLVGRLIEEDDLLALLEECERVNGGDPITFFEITTCAAFLAFARVPADVLLLETGLGGRLDATNVVDRPLLTVLTPISFDHMQHLGTTLTQIAREKAGILKPSVPVVVGPQPAEALAVIDARARELAVSLISHGTGWTAMADGDGFRFRDSHGSKRLPLPALPGPHQIDNAGIALACLRFLGRPTVEEAHLRRGLETVDWPARLQRLRRGPLVQLLPPGWDLWLDGGHNAAAGEALGVVAAQWRQEVPGRPLHLVFGMLDTKEPVEFLRPLASHASSVRAVAIPGEHHSLTAAQAAEAATKAGIPAHLAGSVAAALADIVAAERAASRILICGSLYLAGTVLAENA
jgi:dihydrofolate synthase/folylpolyglutamate synthase